MCPTSDVVSLLKHFDRESSFLCKYLYAQIAEEKEENAKDFRNLDFSSRAIHTSDKYYIQYLRVKELVSTI